MTTSDKSALRLGIIGTSWWVDAMYLPALTTLAGVDVVAIAGRDAERARARAEAWRVPASYSAWEEMLDQEALDGVVVAAANPVHYPATKEAIARGIHVLCEKPVADSYPEAAELARMASDAGLVTMVPFTYGFMPGFRFTKRLVDEGYVGRIHHVGLRYHTGYALGDDYLWKLDARRNPTGALGDVGSHFLYLARVLGGEVDALTARLDTVGTHATRDPRGDPYPLAPDTAAVILEYATGGQALLHASSVAYEGTSMDQLHVIEVHGDGGTLRYVCDWDDQQVVLGARVGEGPPAPLDIPDDIWGSVRRSPVHDTYRDVFRTTDAMARGWAKALATGSGTAPDLSEGAAVQRLLDASLLSSGEARRVEIDEVKSG